MNRVNTEEVKAAKNNSVDEVKNLAGEPVERAAETLQLGVNIPLRTRFWNKVKKTDGCWLWLAARSANGYGCITETIGGKRVVYVASRVAYELTNGPIGKGLLVLHKCDTPLCVKPDHLFLGTQLENVKDSMSKGRHTGMDQQAVRDMRARYDQGVSCRTLAKEYGVHRRTVEKIVKRKRWSNIV